MYKPVLMSSGEIRTRLRVSRQRIYQIVAHPGFPPPYQVLKLGKLWDSAEVEAWIRRHRPALAEAPHPPDRPEP
ncbi:AlpA family transcriptional regulator [Actinoplanes sp. DH11]|uniref:helix-turn-helix transcriptional regulator n=1 Tax=Actinoplanes sp. DH11 TaxID=2857011 RepID=UPI001E442C10|nr:helix-turn-helix domain-containing protein [Actinoplanes sp. DH11]